MAYLPYAVVPWYSHMAAPANNGKPTEWPKTDYEVKLRRPGIVDRGLELSNHNSQRGSDSKLQKLRASDTAVSVPNVYGAHRAYPSIDADHLAAAQAGAHIPTQCCG